MEGYATENYSFKFDDNGETLTITCDPSNDQAESISINMSDFMTFMSANIDVFADKFQKYTKKPYVRKNCTIPDELNTLAVQKGLSFSECMRRGIISALEES